MNMREYISSIFVAALLTPLLLLAVQISGAQVMQSDNYRIEVDSVNFGGGLSTSTSYSLESTFGEVATGDLSGDTFNLRSGYQRISGEAYLAMTVPAPVVMSSSILGVTGGEASGSTTVTVTTDSIGGYTLAIRAISSPAMTKGADSIADYVPAGDPDFTFTTDSTEAHFGYSPSGVDTVDRFLDDGVDTCGTGANETALACWDGLDMSDETIAHSSSANTPNGATTTIHFRVGVGSTALPTSGTYTATSTLTALSL